MVKLLYLILKIVYSNSEEHWKKKKEYFEEYVEKIERVK